MFSFAENKMLAKGDISMCYRTEPQWHDQCVKGVELISIWQGIKLINCSLKQWYNKGQCAVINFPPTKKVQKISTTNKVKICIINTGICICMGRAPEGVQRSGWTWLQTFRGTKIIIFNVYIR
jgi:hypothetical protein